MTGVAQSLYTDNPLNADPTPRVPSFKGGLQQYAFTPTSSPPPGRPTPASSTPAATPPLTRSHLKRKAPSPSSPLSPSPISKKPKPPPSASAPPSKSAHLPNNVNDSVAPSLICIFIGLNPGLLTAHTGHAYAHPSNLFWKLLHRSGCTPRLCRPHEDGHLPRLYGLGLTNLVARATRSATGLSRDEMEEGVQVVEAKIRRWKPGAVCVVGKGIWESVWRVRYGRGMGKGEFRYGWQREERMGTGEGWEGARVFVATTTSGVAAGMGWAEKEEVWRELGGWVVGRREEIKGEVGESDTRRRAGEEGDVGSERESGKLGA